MTGRPTREQPRPGGVLRWGGGRDDGDWSQSGCASAGSCRTWGNHSRIVLSPLGTHGRRPASRRRRQVSGRASPLCAVANSNTKLAAGTNPADIPDSSSFADQIDVASLDMPAPRVTVVCDFVRNLTPCWNLRQAPRFRAAWFAINFCHAKKIWLPIG